MSEVTCKQSTCVRQATKVDQHRIRTDRQFSEILACLFPSVVYLSFIHCGENTSMTRST
jgi:hypothetical protein